MTFIAGLITWALIGLTACYIIRNVISLVKKVSERRKVRNAADDKSDDQKGVDNSND